MNTHRQTHPTELQTTIKLGIAGGSSQAASATPIPRATLRPSPNAGPLSFELSGYHGPESSPRRHDRDAPRRERIRGPFPINYFSSNTEIVPLTSLALMSKFFPFDESAAGMNSRSSGPRSPASTDSIGVAKSRGFA